jgi:segregation and condensation protein B
MEGGHVNETSRDKRRVVEALVFGSDEPITLKQLVAVITSAESSEVRMRITEDEILSIIREFNAEYAQTNRAFRIVQVAGGFQHATMPEFADWLGKMYKARAKRRLSRSALETLAVIAYKQPVTKPEIEAIRGVSADYVIGSLLERGLITIVGRAATPGRPLLYGTTQDFLKHFGINDLAELPKPREIDEILQEGGFEMEKELMRRMGKSEEEIEEATSRTVVGENGTLLEIPPHEDASSDGEKDGGQV